MDAPVFSWTVEDAAGEPAWASLTVNVGGETVYQSGEIPEADSLGWRIDLPLKPRTRYDYTLTVRRCKGDSVYYDFTVPFGASAELHLPGEEPKELGAGRYQYEGAQDVLSD